MAERSGFYPSNPEFNINNEYTGYEIGQRIYKNLVSNGIFKNASDELQVVATTGLTVKLRPGEGLFLHQWYYNDADILFTLDGESSLDRIDLIVIEANKSPNVLKTYAKVIKGTPSATPVEPELIDSEFIKQYPIAAVKITAGLTTITQSAIEDKRGMAPTLWVTGVVDQLDTTTLWTQFTAAFWEWFGNLKETLATTTILRKYTGYTHTTSENQKDIPINVSGYNSVLDILQVHVEGRILREGVDYIKNGFTGITLALPLPVVNTQVYFEVFKSVDGSDAESIADLLYQLQNIVNVSKVTKDNGTDKLVIVSNLAQEVLNAGVGFHTIYIPATVSGMPVDNKIWRGFASFTSATTGYIYIISQDGDVYTINYNGSWSAWRCLYQHNIKMLYSHPTGNLLNGSTTIPLGKNISDCPNGIVLHFAKYGSLNNMNFAYHLPKVRYTGAKWNGENICIQMPYEYTTTGVGSVCYKKITVYDNQINGFEGNTLGGSNNMVLVGISEY